MAKKLLYCEIKNPPTHDHDDVRWKDLDTGKFVGYGYVGREKGDMVGLVRCPECGKENYYANVPSGKCTWCPFNANKT